MFVRGAPSPPRLMNESYISFLQRFLGNMSQDLQWLLLKDNTCFIHKQKSNGSTFTSEPNNLTQHNAFKYSGLCNNKTVGVAVSNGKVTLSLKRPKKANRPSKSQAVTVITKHQANGRAAGAEAVR